MSDGDGTGTGISAFPKIRFVDVDISDAWFWQDVCVLLYTGFGILFWHVLKYQKSTTLAGLEPTRDRPNRFLVGRLNHSATVSFLVLCAHVSQHRYSYK